LLDVAKKFKSIINNKETGKFSNGQKQKAWINITNNYNSQCPSGYPRKSEELIYKYRNLKFLEKAQIAEEKKSLKSTGGGPYDGPSTSSLSFGFSDLEIVGVPNVFDSNLNELEAIEMQLSEDTYIVSKLLSYFFLQ
jgi:hypothetical protein